MIVYNINKDISEVYLGDNSISEVYIGANKVYPSEEPPTPVFDGKYKFTVSGGTPIITASCNSSSVLTSGETKEMPYYYNYVEAVIGDCVTSIGDKAFQSFPSLSSITLSNSVTNIGSYGIYNCDSLTTLRIPDSVISIGAWGLADNTNLERITLSSGLTSISDYMMYGSTSLTSVTIPSGVTSIGKGAFGSCSGLTSITVEATVPPTLSTSVFNNTNNCPIYVPCESVNAYKTATNWSNYADRIQCVEPQFSGKYKLTLNDSSVVSAECDSTSAITTTDTSAYQTTMIEAEIGDCVTSIGNGAFRYCSGLTSIDIPSGVTSIGSSTFGFCSSLTSITIPDGVTSIGTSAFIGCSGLTSITVNATVHPTLGAYAFDNTNNCPIYVPSASVEAYKTATNWRRYADRIQPIL